MKLLAFSDVHLDTKFGWASRRHTARRQRQRLRDGVTWAFEQASREGAAAVLIGGDLFEHELVSPDTVGFLRRTFEQADVRVFASPGNHDYADTESPYRRVDWPDNVHIFGETHFTAKTLADGVTIWGAAHRKPADTPGFFDDGFRVPAAGAPDGGVHIAVFHGEERRAAFQGQHRHAPFDSGQIAAAGFDHAVVGHSHAPADRADWTRLGSLERLSFNETYGNAVMLEIEQGRIGRRRLKQRPSGLHSIDVDLTGTDSAAEARRRVVRDLADLTGAARVRLVGEPEDNVRIHPDDFAAGALDLPEGVDDVLVDASGLASPYDLEQLAQEPTVRGMFVRRVQGETLDPETERLVLLAGLRALDSRDIGLVDELRMGAGPDEAPSAAGAVAAAGAGTG